MKFLLDMPLSIQTAVWLRREGHDAVHLREQGLQRLPDAQIVKKAIAEDRIIITMDVGFGQLLAFAGGAKPSIILLRLRDEKPERIHDLLNRYLSLIETNLQSGAIVVIEEHEVRVHSLPILPEGE